MLKFFSGKAKATAAAGQTNLCPDCGCEISGHHWNHCPRCHRELEGHLGCGGCGACNK